MIHHNLKYSNLPFCRSYNLKEVQVILLYSYAPTIHVKLPRDTAQSTKTKQRPQQSSVISHRVRRRRISTERNKSEVEELIVHGTWFILSYLILHVLTGIEKLIRGKC
jgi:hypothetical protein